MLLYIIKINCLTQLHFYAVSPSRPRDDESLKAFWGEIKPELQITAGWSMKC